MRVSELKPFHLDDWLKAHKGWSSGTKHGFARASSCAAPPGRRSGEESTSRRCPVTKSLRRSGRRTTVISPEQFDELLAWIPIATLRTNNTGLAGGRPLLISPLTAPA